MSMMSFILYWYAIEINLMYFSALNRTYFLYTYLMNTNCHTKIVIHCKIQKVLRKLSNEKGFCVML